MPLRGRGVSLRRRSPQRPALPFSVHQAGPFPSETQVFHLRAHVDPGELLAHSLSTEEQGLNPGAVFPTCGREQASTRPIRGPPARCRGFSAPRTQFYPFIMTRTWPRGHLCSRLPENTAQRVHEAFPRGSVTQAFVGTGHTLQSSQPHGRALLGEAPTHAQQGRTPEAWPSLPRE